MRLRVGRLTPPNNQNGAGRMRKGRCLAGHECTTADSLFTGMGGADDECLRLSLHEEANNIGMLAVSVANPHIAFMDDSLYVI